MRLLITRVLPLVGVGAALILGAAGAAASNNASWNVSYSVATATSLVNNTASLNAGAIIPGNLSGGGTDSLTMPSNDPAGVQLTAASVASVIESGAAPCVPQATRTVPGSSLQIIPAATTGGAGGSAGTATAAFFLSTTAQNMFATVPTNTGTLNETLTLQILAPAATQPNSPSCSYTLPVNYVLIAQ